MSTLFNFARPPFDRLDEEARERLSRHLSLCYFRAGDLLLKEGDEPPGLYLIIKGAVEESAPHHQFGDYGVDDLFDVRAQFDGRCRHRFTALEDSLCQLIPRHTFLSLCEQDPQFASYFTANLAERQRQQEQREQLGQKNLAEFILTRIEPGHLQAPLIVDSKLSLLAATEAMVSKGTDCLLYPAHDGSLTLATRKTLLHALTLKGLPLTAPLSVLTPTSLIGLPLESYLFDALLLMTRHRIKRLVVWRGNEVAGILQLTQVLGLFSTHSHVLTLRIARADSLPALEAVAREQQQLTRSLFAQGIHTAFLMKLIATINEQLIAKAFALVIPPEVQDKSLPVDAGLGGARRADPQNRSGQRPDPARGADMAHPDSRSGRIQRPAGATRLPPLPRAGDGEQSGLGKNRHASGKAPLPAPAPRQKRMSCSGSPPWPMLTPSRGIASSICRLPERCASSWRTDGICWRRWCDRRWPFMPRSPCLAGWSSHRKGWI